MIINKFKTKKTLLSLEVFPPKKSSNFTTAFQTLDELSILNPAFISVTYGAGGSDSKKTIEIASYIQNKLNISALTHLTCVGCKKEELLSISDQLAKANITNVLALRGDRPVSMTDEQFNHRDFTYATDMVRFLHDNSKLHIAGACYPEKHFEASSLEADIEALKRKVDQGLDFLITQLFFDNTYFYKFKELALAAGISIPICTGIMPITAVNQLSRTISLSGSSVPKTLADIIATYGANPDDMRKAGIDFAINQCLDLHKNGVDGLHLYTMNKSSTATEIVSALPFIN